MSEQPKNENWMNNKWRPMMGWVYMVTCTFDFIIAPILWAILQASNTGDVTLQWDPITLRGAGLYHVAMGAVLGLTAFGRTQEKLGGATAVPKSMPAPVSDPEPEPKPKRRASQKIPD